MNIPQNITFSIDLNKIDEQYVVTGKNGSRYVDLKLVNTPDNQYGSDYMVTQALPKAVREEIKNSGAEWPKTPIIGNGNAWQVAAGTMNTNKRSRSEDAQESSSFQAASYGSNDDMPF